MERGANMVSTGHLLVLCMLLSVALAAITNSFVRENVIEESQVGVHWALIVAGSNGYYNYRHQADICHAYQILHSNGIPDERIVVMMYDDIAYSEENPTQGIIVNHINGSDVYRGVPKDYTQEDVTPENFLKILQGDEDGMKGIGSGKVIKSGPNDDVFVNFADHGAPGIVAFPSGELTASALNDAIQSMHDARKYKKMVFYVEACESGSMFSNLLPTNISVYATTAANGEESSYACYYDDFRDTYLGDVYSVMWMEDSDVADLSKETLTQQYQTVKQKTNTSHVMRFGDESMGTLPLIKFEGDGKSAIAKPLQEQKTVPLDAIPSPDVKLSILSKRWTKAPTEADRHKYHALIKQELKLREYIDTRMRQVVDFATKSTEQADRIMSVRHQLRDHDCYEPVMHHFSTTCFPLHKVEYALRQLYTLVNLCEENIPPSMTIEAIDVACLH
ncbi:PREDICTED: legumain-like [Priapulus caudatus]|uniref:legumain n=1 Tax=Priapulus caudatus TaxID=37621 RepID=A0ABM1E3J2_PRICU|nr:PREDICTED: legumain-like [Priapulus caudatus]